MRSQIPSILYVGLLQILHESYASHVTYINPQIHNLFRAIEILTSDCDLSEV